jgi:flagellar basal-body rod protein FlgG
MYAAASGMAAQQQRLDALSNDLANVNTVGYKRLRVAFRDLVYTPTGPGGQAGVMEGSGSAATAIGRGNVQASLKSTEEPMDVAIMGPGFLRVRHPDGTVGLTRNGQLTVDVQRRLNANGMPLEPRIIFPAGVEGKDLSILPDGRLNAAGAVIGRLPLVTVRSPERLRSIGDNLQVATPQSGNPVAAGANTTVRQGVLESSDVDMGDAMADMMIAQRNYSLASRAINMQDQMAQIANGLKK